VSGVAQKSYGEFSLEFHRRIRSGQRIPLQGTLELTRRCNLDCAHCYTNLLLADQDARGAELTVDEYARILDEVAAAGCLWLLVTGGEIFARPDALEIYTLAKRRGFLITLFTNGTLIDDQIAAYLAEWRPFKVEITIYGATAATHEAITGEPGSFARCLAGARRLLDRGVPLSLKTIVMTGNHHEIAGMQQIAADMGLGFRFDGMINPRIDGVPGPTALRLEPREIVALDLADPARMKDWQRFCGEFVRPSQSPERAPEMYCCGAGVSSFAIGPSGALSLCGFSTSAPFDLRSGSFLDGWNGLVRAERSRLFTRTTKCTLCRIKPLCGLCPALACLETGDAETPVDFLCHVAHLRAAAFGWEVPLHGACEFCPGGTEWVLLEAEIAEIDADTPDTAGHHPGRSE
jgi:radical SAM protein with 4Fe4S-binding SPASM domain